MEKQKSIDRREKIIDATIAIIHNEGYSSLSIRRIAKKAGISFSAIYNYFDSKEEIVIEALDRFVSIELPIGKKLTANNGNKDTVENFISVLFTHLDKHPEMISIFLSNELYLESERVEKEFQRIRSELYRALSKVYQEQSRNGSSIYYSADDLSLITIGIIREALLGWKNLQYNLSLEIPKLQVLCKLREYQLI